MSKVDKAPLHSSAGNVIRYPQRPWKPENTKCPCSPMPGVVIGALYPPEEVMNSGVHLPSRGGGWETEGGAAENRRPDAVYVLGVGGRKEHETGDRPHISDYVCPGDTIMVRPYSGMRVQEYLGVRGFISLGVQDPIFDDIIAVQVKVAWSLVHNWVAINLKEDRTIQTPVLYKNKVGRVVDYGDASSARYGTIAIVGDELYELPDPFDARFIFTDNGPYGDDGDVVLVREVGHENKAYVGLVPHTYVHAYATD